MVDRSARDQMVVAIRSYMDESINSSSFDEKLSEITLSTKDEIVLVAGNSLWYTYDDYIEHDIGASKDQWDFFNRLLLLLESDCEFETSQCKRIWTYRQCIAAACLACYAGIASITGIGLHLFLYSVPFGLISILINWLEEREANIQNRLEKHIVPFNSIGEMLTVRSRIPSFTKLKYPKEMKKIKVRGWADHVTIGLPFWAGYLFFAPIPLLMQVLPERKWDMSIRTPV